MELLGIDIGGTGIKGAVVQVTTGTLVSERYRVPTPHPATPKRVVEVVAEIARYFRWHGALGCTLPAVVRDGVALTAANIDHAWIGHDARASIEAATGLRVTVLNDADAAGVAELRYGAGRDRRGTVLLLTFGTGIGSALFVDGHLVPNTELGHLPMGEVDAEARASDRAREQHNLSWKKWARRANAYFALLDRLFSPDLLILGGGISKESSKYLHLLTARAEIVPAQLRNEAGIVGAALAAAPLSAPLPVVAAIATTITPDGPAASARATAPLPVAPAEEGATHDGLPLPPPPVD